MDNSMGDLFIVFLMNLAFTVVMYETVPIILRFIMKKSYSEKEARKIATRNTVCVYILITCFHIFILGEGKVANIAPAFLWGTVAFYILKSNKTKSKSYNDTQNEETNNMYKQNNSKNYISNKEEIINTYMDRSGLSKEVCTYIYNILILAQNGDNYSARKMIHDVLIPQLKSENIVSNVGIAFGMLTNDILLAQDEAEILAKQVMSEMVELNEDACEVALEENKTVYCTNCGNKIDETANFCNNCGNNIRKGEKENVL